MMERELPKGWTETSVGEICTQLRGISYGKGDAFAKEFDESILVLRGGNIQDGKIVSNEDDNVYVHKSLVKDEQRVRKGDVIIVSSTGSKQLIGKAAHATKDLPTIGFGAFLTMLRPHKEIESGYFDYFFQTEYYRQSIRDLSGGVNINNIRREHLEHLEFPFPPLREQKRIVTKLDAAFAHLEKLKVALERIPEWLKAFRQAVLIQAVTGKLTALSNDEGFKIVSLNEIAERIQIGPFGTQLHKHDYISNGIPLINPSHIKSGKIEPDFDLTVSKEKYDELENYHLKIGDVIMGRRGEMGRCASISEREDGWLCGTGSLFIRPNESVYPRFLYWTLSSEDVKKFLEAQSKGSTMSNLNLSIIKSIEIPLPSLDEQESIFKKVDNLLTRAAALEAVYRSLKEKIDSLPQVLLAKAFRGELVAQDESDEPAAVLLEQIKKAKATKPSAKQQTLYGENEELSVAAEAQPQLTLFSPIPPNKKGFAKYVLAGKIIKECRNQKEFTHIRFQKLQHLAEYLLEEDLEQNFYYQAAGPFDNKLMHNLANRMKNQKWFREEGYAFIPLAKEAEVDRYFQTYFRHRQAVFDNLLAELGGATEAQCEIVSTLFAVWNNMLIQKEEVIEEEIISRFYCWSDRKKKYSEERLRSALQWMREKGFGPKGFGPLIKQAKGSEKEVNKNAAPPVRRKKSQP